MEQVNHDMKQEGLSMREWEGLVDRYFEAQATEEEEALLRRFLATDRAVGEVFDEARAVMGFLAVGKSVRRKRRLALPARAMKWMVAATVCCIVGTTVWKVIDRQQNVCVAYIYGEKCTDTREVMKQLEYSIHQVGHETESHTLENQLNDVFKTLKEGSK